jgi:hypothetical protein
MKLESMTMQDRVLGSSYYRQMQFASVGRILTVNKGEWTYKLTDKEVQNRPYYDKDERLLRPKGECKFNFYLTGKMRCGQTRHQAGVEH